MYKIGKNSFRQNILDTKYYRVHEDENDEKETGEDGREERSQQPGKGGEQVHLPYQVWERERERDLLRNRHLDKKIIRM